MKNLLYILILCGLTSCIDNTKFIDTPVKCEIDSVEYHGIGQDNTLQTTPYWKVRLKKEKVWIRTSTGVKYSKGDSIIVIYRTKEKPTR
jgi:hypothetical protein